MESVELTATLHNLTVYRHDYHIYEPTATVSDSSVADH